MNQQIYKAHLRRMFHVNDLLSNCARTHAHVCANVCMCNPRKTRALDCTFSPNPLVMYKVVCFVFFFVVRTTFDHWLKYYTPVQWHHHINENLPKKTHFLCVCCLRLAYKSDAFFVHRIVEFIEMISLLLLMDCGSFKNHENWSNTILVSFCR